MKKLIRYFKKIREENRIFRQIVKINEEDTAHVFGDDLKKEELNIQQLQQQWKDSEKQRKENETKINTETNGSKTS